MKKRPPNIDITSVISVTFLVVLSLLSLVSRCHGDSESANHLVLFDAPPDGVSIHKTAPFDIRTNFTGTVNLVESRDFRVVVNITAPTLGQAYDVSTRFVAKNYPWPTPGMMLEVKQGESTEEFFNFTWLIVTLAVLTLFVAIFTGFYAIRWYDAEHEKQRGFSEQKSYGSSSHRTGNVYRSRNSIQLGGLHDATRPDDALRGDEELRQVREMPEEEEAEAFEMEQLKKLKFKDESDDLMPETEDSDPQERNLTKYHVHSHAKIGHKELLKKPTGKKSPAPPPPPPYKRTHMGRYEGVPTHDTDETSDDDRERTLPLRGGSADKMMWSSSSGQDLRAHLDNDSNRSTSSLSTFGRKSQERELKSNIRKSENDLKNSSGVLSSPTSETDPNKLVRADVHPSGKPVMVSITPRDSSNTSNKSARPGNIYVPPSELKAASSKMSTFGQRNPSILTSTPTSANTRSTSPSSTTPQSHSTNDNHQPQSKPQPPSTPPTGGRGASRQDVTKNFQENTWGTPGLLSMSDIQEDPREDDQSGISGSQKSASMYGSSEIFEIPETGNTYYNLDSDIDIPPLDSDDNLWSDGGLPSPSPRLWSPRTAAEKGKTNDDIKLIPGALKSPGPNSGKLSVLKPRPNSSIQLQSERSPGGRGGRSLQPPPPSYEDIVSNQSNTAFEFPPPPTFLQTPAVDDNVDSDDKLGSSSANRRSGDYVLIKHDGNEKEKAAGASSRLAPPVPQKKTNGDAGKPNSGGGGGGRGGGGGGGGKKSHLGPTYMNMTVLCTLCVLSLATTGVMCQLLSNEEGPRVDITIFAPAHFFTNETRVFFNKHKDTEALGLEDKAVLVYDASSPWQDMTHWYPRFCNRTCQQGCDESRGECMCLKGYRLGPHGKCEDVNECMESRAKCDKSAGCYNRKGSYDCICGEDYYGNGKTCRECQQGCPKDHYEEQPCSSDRQKICKACTKSCRDGFYLAHKCGTHQNALCRVCQPECGQGEFESRQCTNFHDRICTRMSRLTLPDVSSNVMMEERSRVKSDNSRLEKLPSHYVGFSRYNMSRGTDFFVEMTVRFMNPTPNFLPVNLSHPFDLDLVAPAVLGSFVVQRYCPTPVPDYYVFSYKKHQNLTYKLLENGSIEACETHKQFGEFLDDEDGLTSNINVVGSIASMEQGAGGAKNRDSFVCAQPGSLTNNFVMDEDFFHARTKWVDKNKRCQRNSKACEACTRKCGTDMFNGDPLCAIDREGKEDGISPRLMTCYNCCVKKKCSTDCKDYHKRRCRPEQCLSGNLLEFTLKPSWDSSQDSKFFCHIKPVEGQRLLEMDYRVRHASLPTPLYSSSIKLYGDGGWLETGTMDYSDGILDVEVDSGLKNMPDFLEGAISTSNTIFKVGSYKDKGTKFGSSLVTMDFVYVRPSTPTAIPSMPRAQQDCTNHELDQMNLATKMENPYIQDPELEGVANGSLPFTVHHKRQGPKVNVKLNKETRLLKKLFSIATLTPGSFHGNTYNNGSHWVVNVSATVSQCPGYLGVRIQDPINTSKNIYDMDIVVFCPKTFNLTFAILTSDEVSMFKDVMVVIHDQKAEHHFRLYHTSQDEDRLRRKEPAKDLLTPLDENLPYASKHSQPRSPKGSSGGKDDHQTPEYPIEIPYLIAIAGIVIFLLVLAIIGLCFLPDIPETPLVRLYHPFFAIVYMVIQFVYSVMISASVFFLILIVVTSPYVKLVNQHGQKGGTTSSRASSRLELLQLQRHMEKEVARQDSEVDKYQMHCIYDVKMIVDDMNRMHQDLLKSTSDVFERHRLDLLLEEQKIFVRQKLTQELKDFRDDYLKASRSILRRIRQDAAASYQNIDNNNTWLEGARFLHKIVKLFQETHKRKVQTFMEWTGINVEESSLDIDMAFSLPALPRLDEIQAPPPVYKPPIKRDLKEAAANEMIRSIQVHNNWFFPLADSVLGAVSGYKPQQTEESLTERKEAATMYWMFVIMLIVCDFILLCHRMTKAWTTARLILFGFPEYYRERKEDEMGDDDVMESKESRNKLAPVQSCRDSPWVLTVKMFFTQTISTTFLPKMVGAVAACVVLMCVLRVSNKYLTVSGLQELGLYHNVTHSVSLQVSVTNGRIGDHAVHINSLEYPSFQALTNAHLNTHKTVFGFYRRQLHGLQNLTAQMYCLHLKDIGIPSNCSDLLKGQGLKDDDLAWLQMEALTHACQFQPVIPQLFHRQPEAEHPPSERQVDTLLESLRSIIFYSSHLVIIFLIIIVLKELAFATIWILLQRSGVIRVRIIVEQDQGDTSQS